MDKIQFKCPCGKVLVVDAQHTGKMAKCPVCQRTMKVPAKSAAPAPEHIVPTKDIAKDITSLSEQYHKATKDKNRQMKVDEMLHDLRRKRLRWQIPLMAVVGIILIVLLYKITLGKKIGPEIQNPEGYSITIQTFLPDLNKQEAPYRASAVFEIGDIIGLEAFKLVSIMSEDPAIEVKLISIQKMEKMAVQNDLNVTTSIEKMLDDPNIDVRMTAAFALAKINSGTTNPESLRQHVSKAIKNPEWEAWHKQATSEKAVKTSILPKMKDMMNSGDPQIRSLAVWLTVSTIGPVADLMPLLKDPDPAVAASTIRALTPFLSAEQLNSLSGQPAEALRERLSILTSIALCLKQPSPEVRTAAAIAISGSACDETARMLGSGLSSDDWFVRYMLLKGLLRVNPRLAREIIRLSPEPDGVSKNERIMRIRRRIEELARKEAGEEPLDEYKDKDTEEHERERDFFGE